MYKLLKMCLKSIFYELQIVKLFVKSSASKLSLKCLNFILVLILAKCNVAKNQLKVGGVYIVLLPCLFLCRIYTPALCSCVISLEVALWSESASQLLIVMLQLKIVLSVNLKSNYFRVIKTTLNLQTLFVRLDNDGFFISYYLCKG